MTEGHSPCTAPACHTCERWRAYGAVVDGILRPFYTNWFAEPAYEPICAALDALASLMTEHARLELALTDARSDLESFMEHHKATEAQNARLRVEAANRLPISKSVTRRLDAQGVTGKVGKITKAEPR